MGRELAAKRSQGRNQAIFALSTTLRADPARALGDLVRLLRDQQPRITEITIENPSQ